MFTCPCKLMNKSSTYDSYVEKGTRKVYACMHHVIYITGGFIR